MRPRVTPELACVLKCYLDKPILLILLSDSPYTFHVTRKVYLATEDLCMSEGNQDNPG